MSGSNCCFLTYIQVSQEAGKVVCYSHLLKNFPQFVVIHRVKVSGVVNKAGVDVFLELSYFFYDLTDVTMDEELTMTHCVIHYVTHITFYLLWVQALGFSIIITVSCRVSSLPLKSSVLFVFFPLPPRSLATTDLFTFFIILPFLGCCVVQSLSRERVDSLVGLASD